MLKATCQTRHAPRLLDEEMHVDIQMVPAVHMIRSVSGSSGRMHHFKLARTLFEDLPHSRTIPVTREKVYNHTVNTETIPFDRSPIHDKNGVRESSSLFSKGPTTIAANEHFSGHHEQRHG